MMQFGGKVFKANVKKFLFRVLYPDWSVDLDRLTPGYSVILPVPPDLPVLFKLSLDVIGAQDPLHRHEVIVVPDRPDEAFRAYVEMVRQESPELNLRYVEPSGFDLRLRSVANTSTIHWMQVLCGMRVVNTTHLLLHDADLFISDPSFFRSASRPAWKGSWTASPSSIGRTWPVEPTSIWVVNNRTESCSPS